MLPESSSRTALLTGLFIALAAPAFSQTLHPVISRVDLRFSIVGHYSHLVSRADFYNAYGQPRGNTNYAVPHLVYEPVVTLYNPHNETLTLTRPRIRISDPPVGFQFSKQDAHLRSAFGSGEYHGLARFQTPNESNLNARKSFTLSLSSLNSNGRPGGPIVLRPGESRTFSTWVERDWSWGAETAGGFNPYLFFDWNASNDFTNRDPRTTNRMGVEAVSSEFLYQIDDPRAGFQTDSLSLAEGRPTSTHYDFEIARNWTGPWVGIKQTDTFRARAKITRTHPISPPSADFRIELLRGRVEDPSRDLIRGFSFSLADIRQSGPDPIVERTVRMGDIVQTAAARSVDGKTPLATLTVIAKAGAVRRNDFYSTPPVPTEDLYEGSFAMATDFHTDPLSPTDAPVGGLEVFGTTRVGDTLFVDFSGPADRLGVRRWKVRGTSSLEDGFRDDLDSVTTVANGQSVSGVFKAAIDVSGRGPRYFVRIEQ